MKKRCVVSWVLLPSFLAGCVGSQEPANTTVAEITASVTEQIVLETTVPDVYASGENKMLLDLDGDGQMEVLVYRDGVLRRILSLDSEGERMIMEEATMFLCDDRKTILCFGEGAGGHTWCYYRFENGEMVPFECLVYHWEDNRYFRSEDYSARDDSLVEVTVEEYRQAMADFPCAEAENSFLGVLF